MEGSVEILLKVQDNLRFSLEKAEGRIKDYEQKFLDLSKELGTMIERVRELELQITIKDIEITKLKALISGVCPILDTLEDHAKGVSKV